MYWCIDGNRYELYRRIREWEEAEQKVHIRAEQLHRRGVEDLGFCWIEQRRSLCAVCSRGRVTGLHSPRSRVPGNIEEDNVQWSEEDTELASLGIDGSEGHSTGEFGVLLERDETLDIWQSDATGEAE
jgi:hypothetical protein